MPAVNPPGFDVSVVIPTHDRRDLVGRAIDSVLGQSLPPAEVIVVDDGSGDGTADWLQRAYPQVRLLALSQNRGVSHARNRGIEAAGGDWIAFLDSDDEWLPDKLAAQREALSGDPGARFCHTDERWVRNGVRVNPRHRHRKRGGRIFSACLPMCVVSPSSVLMHRTLFDEVGLFDESLPACEDYDLWLRICLRHPALLVDRPLLVKYGGHADQLSRRHWGMDRFRVLALEKLLAGDLANDAERAEVEAVLVEKLRILAAGAARRGRDEAARAWCGRIEQLRRGAA